MEPAPISQRKTYIQPIAPRDDSNKKAGSTGSTPTIVFENGEGQETTPDPATNQKSRGAASNGSGSKRAHKRTYQPLMSYSKLFTPLKKRDGEALWRKDIQYDFLNAVFTDQNRAFRASPGSDEKLTFAELYLRAMANSTRCSKILGEKLLGDHQAGIKIAMVCLLVNWGRMNTTLNFFPEMKTVLRTYHPIPSLQTHDAPDYKQLQDAPRLKSILKGACEVSEPTNFYQLEASKERPRTNPINLVFLMSAFSRIVERNMKLGNSEFSYFDILMDTKKSSKSRARVFLWLVWAYLESPDFYDNSENPFGTELPQMDPLTPEEEMRENIDTPAELLFGNQMTLQRLAILDTPSSAGAASEETENAAAPAKANGHEKVEKQALVTPKPRLRSAKDRRIQDEFSAVLRAKRESRKFRRRKRNNAMRDTWNRIAEIDPLYDTDEDRQQALINGKSHGLGPGVTAAGVGTNYSDYGERSLSVAISIKRACRRIKTLKEEEVS